jgi:hypothetical protein
MALRPRFTTPFSRLRDKFVQYVVRPFKVFTPNTRFAIGFGLLVLVTTPLLLSNYASGFSEDYREGDVIRGSVIARADISGVDISETERRRNAARLAARPVFSFDSTRGTSSARSFRAAWEDLERQVDSRANGKPLTWSGEGGTAIARALGANVLRDDDLERITRLIREVSDKYVYASAADTNAFVDRSAARARIKTPGPARLIAGTEAGHGRINIATYPAECSFGSDRHCYGAGDRSQQDCAGNNLHQAQPGNCQGRRHSNAVHAGAICRDEEHRTCRQTMA